MKARSIFYTLLFSSTALLLSCSDDDEKGPSYSFKNQDLQGKIEGGSWTYADGYVETTTLEGVESLSVNLMLTQVDGACGNFSVEGDEVFFFVPNAVGLYKLSFDLGSFDGQVVTLYDDDDGGPDPINVIATKGAIEILTITDTEVTGRIDARADKDNFVNGNFTVSFCPGS
ncbi:MAG: hypothetical protein JNJ75_11430 [Cyclobacteriaceae bacterium]|nr:hypothetical protein [Cyclobacteriaceae bacterium]